MTKKLQILIADDDKFTRQLVKDALAETPYALLEAADGEETSRLIAQKKPAVVFLDLVMPKKSGLEILLEIPRQSPDTRTVILSSMDVDSLVNEALSKGAVDFLSKPFKPTDITRVLTQVLGPPKKRT